MKKIIIAFLLLPLFAFSQVTGTISESLKGQGVGIEYISFSKGDDIATILATLPKFVRIDTIVGYVSYLRKPISFGIFFYTYQSAIKLDSVFLHEDGFYNQPNRGNNLLPWRVKLGERKRPFKIIVEDSKYEINLKKHYQFIPESELQE